MFERQLASSQQRQMYCICRLRTHVMYKNYLVHHNSQVITGDTDTHQDRLLMLTCGLTGMSAAVQAALHPTP